MAALYHYLEWGLLACLKRKLSKCVSNNGRQTMLGTQQTALYGNVMNSVKFAVTKTPVKKNIMVFFFFNHSTMGAARS